MNGNEILSTQYSPLDEEKKTKILKDWRKYRNIVGLEGSYYRDVRNEPDLSPDEQEDLIGALVKDDRKTRKHRYERYKSELDNPK